jgi:NADPH-dependent 2,4-dienoyl-CoA reductase/sulfur reductase-like enzyme
MADLPASCDVLIVGGGPAGLAAAAALGPRLAVHLVEREPDLGGIPRHCAHSPFGMREFRRLLAGPAYARRLAAAARAAGAQLHPQVGVTALHPGGRVAVTTPDGTAEIAARAVLLATGCRETPRPPRLVGGTRPGGVLNTGALQGLVHLDRLKPFARPLVVGTELVAFSALLTCRQAGIRPLAMVEPAGRVTARAPLRLLAAALGVPVLLRTELRAIHGRCRVEAATLAGPDGEREIETDGIVLTGRFRPENALLRSSHIALDPATRGPSVDQFGRCSDPAYFAAGNLLRAVETAGWCWAEGRAVAGAIAAALAGRLPPPEPASPVRLDAPGLAWVLPQRLATAGHPPALSRLQLRADRDLDGRLALGPRRHRLRTRPERRIALPLPDPAGPVTLSLESR